VGRLGDQLRVQQDAVRLTRGGGAREVRAAVELVRAKALEPPARGVETVTKVTVEIEGNARPALVAEWVTRQYAAEEP
jgi:hypothetical protein